MFVRSKINETHDTSVEGDIFFGSLDELAAHDNDNEHNEKTVQQLLMDSNPKPIVCDDESDEEVSNILDSQSKQKRYVFGTADLFIFFATCLRKQRTRSMHT